MYNLLQARWKGAGVGVALLLPLELTQHDPRSVASVCLVPHTLLVRWGVRAAPFQALSTANLEISRSTPRIARATERCSIDTGAGARSLLCRSADRSTLAVQNFLKKPPTHH